MIIQDILVILAIIVIAFMFIVSVMEIENLRIISFITGFVMIILLLWGLKV